MMKERDDDVRRRASDDLRVRRGEVEASRGMVAWDLYFVNILLYGTSFECEGDSTFETCRKISGVGRPARPGLIPFVEPVFRPRERAGTVPHATKK